jgi:aarF domain-containing kinase
MRNNLLWWYLCGIGLVQATIIFSNINSRLNVKLRKSGSDKRTPWRRESIDQTQDRYDAIPLLLQQWSQRISLQPIVLVASTFALIGKTVTSQPARRALYFWRRFGPIVAHYKFAQWWLNHRHADSPAIRHDVYERLHTRYAQPTMETIVHLRGLFVKVGQVLSARPDILPGQYLSRFTTLQDDLPQWPFRHVQDIVERSFASELGLTWDDVFESMDEEALGSASIGQAHRAVLKHKWADDSFRTTEVAVKIMHPRAKEQFAHDFTVFRWLCRIALPDWMGLLDELERRLMSEFDYRDEAVSLRDVRTNIVCSPYKRRVCIPQPLEKLCTTHVLVMEMLSGKKLVENIESKLGAALSDDTKAKAFLSARKRELVSGIDTDSRSILESTSLVSKLKLFVLGRQCQKMLHLLVEVQGYQIFNDGCFNGDPHPGNTLELDDGRLGLIDYGQTRRLSNDERLSSARVVAVLGKESRNNTEIAAVMRTAGFAAKDPGDDEMLVRYATLFFDDDSEGNNLGFASPQLYFASLMARNPLTKISDEASKCRCKAACLGCSRTQLTSLSLFN